MKAGSGRGDKQAYGPVVFGVAHTGARLSGALATEI